MAALAKQKQALASVEELNEQLQVFCPAHTLANFLVLKVMSVCFDY
jgi:hypothetical protein